MHFRRTSTTLLVAAPFALGAASALGQHLTHVPSANPKIPGVTSPTVLSPELVQIVRAQGSMPVENPTPTVKYYGYLNDHPNMLPALGSNVEASKTEPDKNTYLVLHGLKGAAPTYDYGTHFVFSTAPPGIRGPSASSSVKRAMAVPAAAYGKRRPTFPRLRKTCSA